MANSLITSANAVAILTVETLFGAPIKLENWGSNEGWDPTDWIIGTGRMSLDGHHNMSFKIQSVKVTLTFSPNSSSLPYIDAIVGASVQGQTPYKLGLELSHKDLSRKFTYLNGHIVSYTPSPAGKDMLADRKVVMEFGKMIPEGI